MRKAKARRVGLTTGKVKELRKLEDEQAALEREIESRRIFGIDASIEQTRLDEVLKQIEVLKRKIAAVPYVDPMDLRYTFYAKYPQPAVQAVMVCIMDTSGSMDETKKELAKTFFLLLYLFLEKNYEHIEICYVRHHTYATEVDEEAFYHAQDSGGTVVSSGLEKAYEIIKERYPLNQWNVYMAQASDGDNYPSDNQNVDSILRSKILPICQYFAYVQIDPEADPILWKSLQALGVEANLWNIYEGLTKSNPNVGVAKVVSEKDIYPSFEKLFAKKKV
jgi:uncharacterized sporulation protein YeaH/YhbH (DUF444 family)